MAQEININLVCPVHVRNRVRALLDGLRASAACWINKPTFRRKGKGMPSFAWSFVSLFIDDRDLLSNSNELSNVIWKFFFWIICFVLKL